MKFIEACDGLLVNIDRLEAIQIGRDDDIDFFSVWIQVSDRVKKILMLTDIQKEVRKCQDMEEFVATKENCSGLCEAIIKNIIILEGPVITQDQLKTIGASIIIADNRERLAELDFNRRFSQNPLHRH